MSILTTRRHTHTHLLLFIKDTQIVRQQKASSPTRRHVRIFSDAGCRELDWVGSWVAHSLRRFFLVDAILHSTDNCPNVAKTNRSWATPASRRWRKKKKKRSSITMAIILMGPKLVDSLLFWLGKCRMWRRRCLSRERWTLAGIIVRKYVGFRHWIDNNDIMIANRNDHNNNSL